MCSISIFLSFTLAPIHFCFLTSTPAHGVSALQSARSFDANVKLNFIHICIAKMLHLACQKITLSWRSSGIASHRIESHRLTSPQWLWKCRNGITDDLFDVNLIGWVMNVTLSASVVLDSISSSIRFRLRFDERLSESIVIISKAFGALLCWSDKNNANHWSFVMNSFLFSFFHVFFPCCRTSNEHISVSIDINS